MSPSRSSGVRRAPPPPMTHIPAFCKRQTTTTWDITMPLPAASARMPPPTHCLAHHTHAATTHTHHIQHQPTGRWTDSSATGAFQDCGSSYHPAQPCAVPVVVPLPACAGPHYPAPCHSCLPCRNHLTSMPPHHLTSWVYGGPRLRPPSL